MKVWTSNRLITNQTLTSGVLKLIPQFLLITSSCLHKGNFCGGIQQHHCLNYHKIIDTRLSKPTIHPIRSVPQHRTYGREAPEYEPRVHPGGVLDRPGGAHLRRRRSGTPGRPVPLRASRGAQCRPEAAIPRDARARAIREVGRRVPGWRVARHVRGNPGKLRRTKINSCEGGCFGNVWGVVETLLVFICSKGRNNHHQTQRIGWNLTNR